MSGRWVAAVVRKNSEPEVVEAAVAMGWDCYCPYVSTYRRVPKHRRNKVGAGRELITMPLFPGYVFMRKDGTDEVSCFDSVKAIIAFVRNRDRLCHARDEDVTRLKGLVARGFYDGVDPVHAEVDLSLSLEDLVGNRVVVSAGPLEGFSGLAVADKDDCVMVEMAGRKVKFDRDVLRLA